MHLLECTTHNPEVPTQILSIYNEVDDIGNTFICIWISVLNSVAFLNHVQKRGMDAKFRPGWDCQVWEGNTQTEMERQLKELDS